MNLPAPNINFLSRFRRLYGRYLLFSLGVLPLLFSLQDLRAQSGEAVLSTSSIGGMVTIGEIRFEGNRLTRRNVLIREMSIDRGAVVPRDSLDAVLETNRLRLMNMALFTDVTLVRHWQGVDSMDLEIRVREQWYIIPELSFQLADRNFNVWWTEQGRDLSRTNLGVTLKHRNFRGNTETLGVTAQLGYTRKFGLEYLRPYVDRGQKHGLGMSFFWAENEEIVYTTYRNKQLFVRRPGQPISRQWEVAGIYTFRPGYAIRHFFEIRYQDLRVDDTVIQLNPEFFDGRAPRRRGLQLTYRLDYNQVDNWNYPLLGKKGVFHLYGRGGLQGFDYQTYVHAEIGYFHRWFPKVYSSHLFRGRLSFPGQVPYSLSQAMGINSEYLRGYEYYVMDGTHYGLVRTNIKYELVNREIRNIPFRYLPVIPIRIYPKLFFDFGYAHHPRPSSSFLNNRPLYSGGIGVDLVTAYEFKLRLEYAWNQLGEKGLFLHLSSE